MTTRVQMIIETLRANPERRFTARELAQEFIRRYPDELAEKRLNPRYDTEEKLIAQLAAEMGAWATKAAKKQCPNVATRDKPRPRLYYWESNPQQMADQQSVDEPETEEVLPESNDPSGPLSEHELYPLLIEFLHKEHGLFCQRIDEKTSKNSHGNGGNRWLHPDVVALEPLDKHWDTVVKECVRHGNDSPIRLWSFEVKKQLTRGNVRQSFFQAVSNSTWANFGYLVATGLNNDVESELQMLSSLHGIGVLLLNTESLFDSQILIPARERASIDWQSVNRIVNENRDFHYFIEQVGIYSQTGRLVSSVWNR
ncbi:hypothetical protein OQJ46_07490 [Microbulbifer thermotolerans]|uniref:COG2958 family protein n=1 Tax=Microbulbifer thermotolerans TaxID=252514 RepID=UPI00224B526B|nr:hypothetical protein [Microbulbifer thermotolerans]MCX2782828.1 hypothetical protein [Microbulbifer thermotolerans]